MLLSVTRWALDTVHQRWLGTIPFQAMISPNREQDPSTSKRGLGKIPDGYHRRKEAERERPERR